MALKENHEKLNARMTELGTDANSRRHMEIFVKAKDFSPRSVLVMIQDADSDGSEGVDPTATMEDSEASTGSSSSGISAHHQVLLKMLSSINFTLVVIILII